MAVFWVITPCSLIQVYRSFRGVCCLYHQGDTAQQPRRHPSSYSPPWESQISHNGHQWLMLGLFNKVFQLQNLDWASGVAPCCLIVYQLLHWLIGSHISSRFLVRGLLISLMMEAARSSETLVNFYQTTRRYNQEDSHLQKHEGL
jgi:hypothetical protein